MAIMGVLSSGITCYPDFDNRGSENGPMGVCSRPLHRYTWCLFIKVLQPERIWDFLVGEFNY